MRHTREELRQFQALPLEAKVAKTKERITEFYNHYNGNVYLSYSGGKDSTVLMHLIKNTPGVYNVPVVYCDTGLEYPEVRELALEHADVVLKPLMNFRQIIKEKGYPVVSKAVAKNVDYARKSGEESIYYKKLYRFERLKETHPQLYAYCMKPYDEGGLGLDEVLNYMDVPH